VVWAADAVEAFAPHHYTWDFYFAKEGLIAAIKLLLAIEIYLRVFAGLPGARRLANLPLLGLLLLTLAMLGRPNLHTDPQSSYKTIVPVATVGITLILTLVLGLATWFRVPALSLHRAILRGLVLYQLVSSFGMNAFALFGGRARPLFNALVPFAYDILLVYWVFVVWRRRDIDEAPEPVVQRLRRWTST
jgi:hypothetical protein